jgi:deoxyribonuclease (pyrimidine dimer)
LKNNNFNFLQLLFYPMTRINVGIPPEELTQQHLIAELREIKRIPNLVLRGKFSLKNQPSLFTLGTGHVKFFYDKLAYLKDRYATLRVEALKRGYNVQNYTNCFDEAIQKHPEFAGGYVERVEDRDLLLARITQRLLESRIKKEKTKEKTKEKREKKTKTKLSRLF